ncbi:SDR family oxidoreductase [Qipengyuania flava]|nr:SDR family oxidoreductase [Qipengyuania flava]
MEDTEKQRILVLGAGGMLGNAVFRLFAEDSRFSTTGTLRSPAKIRHFTSEESKKLIFDVDVTQDSALASAFDRAKPTTVINCVGIIKQQKSATDPLTALTINAVLPHRLAKLSEATGSRLVHMSTDCVFSGRKGGYTEDDFADADDLYGRTKYLGETDYPHTITLRTSIIGHELESSYSLVDWFLSQKGSVNGYKKAIFSGLPTIVVAQIIRDLVIGNSGLRGVYHLSADPISKFDLLSLLADIYGKQVDIVPDETVDIDRSLNSDRFRQATGYEPLSWPKLLKLMHRDHEQQIQAQ